MGAARKREQRPDPPEPPPPGSTIPRLGSVESSLVGLRGHSGWRRRRRLPDATGRQAAEVAAAAWAVVSRWHGVRELAEFFGSRAPAGQPAWLLRIWSARIYGYRQDARGVCRETNTCSGEERHD